MRNVRSHTLVHVSSLTRLISTEPPYDDVTSLRYHDSNLPYTRTSNHDEIELCIILDYVSSGRKLTVGHRALSGERDNPPTHGGSRVGTKSRQRTTPRNRDRRTDAAPTAAQPTQRRSERNRRLHHPEISHVSRSPTEGTRTLRPDA